jgi:hypothetical protein
MVHAPLPRVFGLGSLLLMLGGLTAALAGPALVEHQIQSANERRRMAVSLREQACACADKACAIRTAKALYRLGIEDRVVIDGYLCLTRFSDTCTLGDLIWPEKFKPHMGIRANRMKRSAAPADRAADGRADEQAEVGE